MLSGQMDFVGQYRAFWIYQVLLWVSGLVGFVVGLATDNFTNTFICVMTGFSLAVVICVPSWKWFNTHRIQFKEYKKDD